MNAKSIQCPSCGKHAAGNFCSHCGSPIVSVCPSCDTEVKPGSRVCHECGESLEAKAASKQWNAQTIAPWVAIGIATIALFVALLSWFGRGDGTASPAPSSLPMTSTVPAPGQPVDLASMSPRDAADRLFNRVMQANEAGVRDTAVMFATMAIQAYAMLDAVDDDARFHLGLIQLVAGNPDAALAQADTIATGTPTHLFAAMLRADAARATGDSAAAKRAEDTYLQNFDAELAAARPGYEHHRTWLTTYRNNITR